MNAPKVYSQEEVQRMLQWLVAHYSAPKDCADALGVSEKHLMNVINGRHPPGTRILKPIGLYRVVVYIPFDNTK